MHDANVRQQEDVDSKRLVEIINEVSQHHTTLIGVISRRADQVKVIINWWNKGDVTSAINALSMQNDLSVSMDVLNVTFAQNHRIEMLNYENVANVIPHCINLVNSKYETHILTGLKSILNILRQFSPKLIQLKQMPLGREVDLAREERLRKADLCIEQFQKFSNCKGYQKALKRQGEEVQENANLVQNQILNLLNTVKADKAEAE